MLAMAYARGAVDDLRFTRRIARRVPDNRHSHRLVVMRSVRLSLYFLIGFLLSAVSVFSYAETISATAGTGYTWAGNNGQHGVSSNPTSACALITQNSTGAGHPWYNITVTGPGSYGGYSCNGTSNWWGAPVTSQGWGGPVYPQANYTCPTGQNWTLSGSTCTRPDCPTYQSRDAATGQCSCPSGTSDTGTACKTSCPVGYHNREPDNGQCEQDCIGRQIQKPDGTCSCTPGQRNTYSFAYGSGEAGNCNDGCAVATLPVSFCPRLPGTLFGLAGSAVTCYTSGSTTGSTCGSNNPTTPNIPVTLAPVIPPDTSGKGEDGLTPDVKNTPDNNKDPVACGSAGGAYYTVNGVGKCGTPSNTNSTDKLTVAKNSSETTNADGTKSITTDTTNAITDQKTGQTTTNKTSTTVTKDAAGNVTGGSATSGSSTGDGDKSGKEPGQCAKEPNSPMCKKGTVPEKGKFTEGQDAKVTAAKDQLRAKFSEVKTSASAMFSGALGTGSGSLPCPPPITVLGKSWTICFSQYSDQLSMIGTFVMLAAAVGAAFIVLRR